MCITIPRILIRAQGTEEAEENCSNIWETVGEKFLSVSAFLLTLIHDIVSILSVRQTKQDWKSDRSAKLKSGSKIHESMNAGFELNN